MYFTYILKSQVTGKYYIGCTNNIIRRIKEHNLGLSHYTKGKGPWILFHQETFESSNEARKREKQIKSWKKRIAIERLIKIAAIV